ncbi:O-methyltransferase [uncultured Arcticibacterium sp.]|uniref:O-methyltransferase n=1 Tax=uncultured Arcticibacterium sp. TaxID=2173042 RepID=UPI0030F9F951
MLIINSEAETYCTSISDPEPPILKEIRRDTNANVLQPRMLSGHFQGRLLSVLSYLVSPKRVLEIGTYTGYSAICLAEGLAEGGKVITIDVNEELEERINNNILKAGFEDKIEHIVGDALQLIPKFENGFDLVFIDANKRNYEHYFDLVIDKVNPNGLIISDNVLWDGKVYDEGSKDLTTKALRKYNLKLKKDKRIQKVLLPLRDGLMVARKIS